MERERRGGRMQWIAEVWKVIRDGGEGKKRGEKGAAAGGIG